MRGNKEEMLESIKAMKYLLNETEKELKKADCEENGTVKAYLFSGETYSFEKIKRNCTTIREMLLQLRKGCE